MINVVTTKNGVKLYINISDDWGLNEGGYFCRVFLDESLKEDYDSFTIYKDILECFENKEEFIQKCCDGYAQNLDDGAILNERFNKIYDEVSTAYDSVNEFYLHHIFANENCGKIQKTDIAELLDTISKAKDLAHEIAEYYT